MIKTQVIGNIGKDAILNQVGEKQVINFSVAHTEKYKNSEGIVTTKTTWINCSWWKGKEQSTSIVNYLKSGTEVYVEGIPDISTYNNSQGQVMPEFRLKVQLLQLLTSKKEN